MIEFSKSYDEFSGRYQEAAKYGENLLPLSIAESNAVCPKFVQDIIIETLNKKPLEYARPSNNLYEIISQKNKYKNVKLGKQNIAFDLSALSLLVHAIKVFTDREDGIIVFTPVYFRFFELIKMNNRILYECQLKETENKGYVIDFDELEKIMSKSEVKLLLICNPHNPVGQIWDFPTLKKISLLAESYGLQIVSDEIHSDLAFLSSKFTSFMKLSDTAIIIDSPTKSFNTQALKIGYAISKDATRITLIENEVNKSGTGNPSLLAMQAMKSVYGSEGELWLKDYKKIIRFNIEYLENTIKKMMPDFSMYYPEASFLVWVDTKSQEKLIKFLKNLEMDNGVLVSNGCKFLDPKGTHFRINCGVDSMLFMKSCGIMVKAYNQVD